MKAKVFGLSLALAALCGASARAQTPSQTPAPAAPPAAAQAKPETKADEKLPAAEMLFDNYLKALGGEAALDKFKSRVTRGSIEIAPMGVKGTFETSQKAPQKAVTTMNLTGLGTLQQGYDGAAGWSKDPFTGLRDLKGGELVTVQRAASINPGGWRKSYNSMKTTGRSKVGEREVYVVEGTYASDTPDKLYFDAQTGLLLRMDSTVDSPQGRVVSETTFDDYKEVDGVKVAHSMRAVLGAATVITRVEEVKHDVALDDKAFAKPTS
ncbi:MAG TPA: hypothetical protein VF297_10955 [Pyrinomonadaceae bacterium]